MTVQVREQQKTPLWRNQAFLKWGTQLFALAVSILFFGILAKQAMANFSESGTQFSWTWITDPSDFLVREGIDLDPDSGIRALAVGALNTIRISATGIFAATFLGTLIGVGRLSSNWIVNKVSSTYIEFVRNIPLLVMIFFMQAIAIALPDLAKQDIGTYWFKASNKGFGFAWFQWRTGFFPWLVFVTAGLVVAGLVAKRRMTHQEETGEPGHSQSWALGVLAVFSLIGWFIWPILSFLVPVFETIADVVDGMPPILVPIIGALLALGTGAWWIRNFFESRRTPAGFGKLTDDDWFRVIFAALTSVSLAVIAFAFSGLVMNTVQGDALSIADLVLKGFGNFWDWLARGFQSADTNPLFFSKSAVVQKGNFIQYGDMGVTMTIPFFAVWFGVTLYTASFIAEIVRGGILAVSKGQTEAAQAVGLSRPQYLRFIILPQAFRVILPPMGNQYLNLFKNTSLGTAVAFADIVAVGSTLMNKNGQTLPIVVVWMLFYVSGSLMISSIVNFYNRRMALVER